MLTQTFVKGSLYGDKAGQLLLFPMVQFVLHPSPSVVLPSSHSSVPAVTLSPQTVMQDPPLRLYPNIQVTQVETAPVLPHVLQLGVTVEQAIHELLAKAR